LPGRIEYNSDIAVIALAPWAHNNITFFSIYCHNAQEENEALTQHMKAHYMLPV
jgi:hypothetical protein